MILIKKIIIICIYEYLWSNDREKSMTNLIVLPDKGFSETEGD